MAHPNERGVRSIEELRERRARSAGTIDRVYSLRLAIPPQVEADYGEDFEFRWFNDVGTKIHVKTEIDTWQKVPGVDPLTVGADDEKRPIKAYLCMKPKEFVREDRAIKDKMLCDVERGIVTGRTEQDELTGDVSYVPKGSGNRIGRVKASTG